MDLSERLYAVAGLVTPGNRLADVGTDHGYIPIYLIEQGKIPHGIAMDVNRGPLERAREHIAQFGLEEQIETRLSDGLENLKAGEADTVVIAGMGGALTVRILERGLSLLPTVRELILQPQSELAKVRRWLWEHDFAIEDEDMVKEDGKYYPMMRVKGGQRTPALSREELQYGPILLEKRHPVLREYLLWERGIKEAILEQIQCCGGKKTEGRRQEVQEALERNARALRIFDEHGGGI